MMISKNQNHPAVTAESSSRQPESKSEIRARASMQPTVQAALTLTDYSKHFGELSINTLVDNLTELTERTSKADLSHAEALLVTQAQTLDAIFHKLARDASKSGSVAGLEAQLRLALKAQSQCRVTIEALAAMKNPRPVAFVQQANIANGPQQVNNGVAVRQVSRDPPAIENPQNKLLEVQSGERLVTSAAGSAGSADSNLAPVGALNRSDNK